MRKFEKYQEHAAALPARGNLDLAKERHVLEWYGPQRWALALRALLARGETYSVDYWQEHVALVASARDNGNWEGLFDPGNAREFARLVAQYSTWHWTTPTELMPPFGERLLVRLARHGDEVTGYLVDGTWSLGPGHNHPISPFWRLDVECDEDDGYRVRTAQVAYWMLVPPVPGDIDPRDCLLPVPGARTFEGDELVILRDGMEEYLEHFEVDAGEEPELAAAVASVRAKLVGDGEGE